MNTKYEVIINNRPIEVESNYNVLQVCNIINIDIPKFCYH
jgi:NADH dehydrogenase/NADH:ubiquinone oxidoreductase subunit G